jgi:hypothetical protein
MTSVLSFHLLSRGLGVSRGTTGIVAWLSISKSITIGRKKVGVGQFLWKNIRYGLQIGTRHLKMLRVRLWLRSSISFNLSSVYGLPSVRRCYLMHARVDSSSILMW